MQGELFPRIGFIVTNLTWHAKRVVRFYNQRGTAEQWIKEGKLALTWTRLSCHAFRDNAVRLQLFALAYNLGNFCDGWRYHENTTVDLDDPTREVDQDWRQSDPACPALNISTGGGRFP